MTLTRLLGCFFIAAAGVGAITAFHEFAKAQSNSWGMKAAVSTMPLDAEIDQRDSNDPARELQKLRSATARNPWDTRSWILLSIEEERMGNENEAERSLLSASQHDRGRDPRWALANFYYRKGDMHAFFQYVNQYRTWTHDGEDGLLRMAAEANPDFSALSQGLPNLQCSELNTLARFLVADAVSIEKIAAIISNECKDQRSIDALAKLTSDLLFADRPAEAIQLWRKIGNEESLYNASFQKSITGEGFDWRVSESSGLHFEEEAGGGEQIAFEENVPDGTVLLFQPVYLHAGESYRLQMNMSTGTPSAAAFHWELVELSTGRHLTSGLDSEAQSVDAVWKFKMPATNKTVALAMFYLRPTGEQPFHGQARLSSVRLAVDGPEAQ